MDLEKGKEKQRDLQSYGVGVSLCRPACGASNPVAEASMEIEKTSLISHFGGV